MSPPTRFWLALSVSIWLIVGAATAQSRIDCSALDSRILKRSVRYCVFIPSGYDAGATQKPPRRYPVLYFLHGLGENEQALMRSGGWGLIEELPREHKAGDFIMAAPSGRILNVYQPDDTHNVIDLLLVTDLEVKGKSNGSRPTPSTYCETIPTPVTSTTASCSIRHPLPNRGRTLRRRCEATRSSICERLRC